MRRRGRVDRFFPLKGYGFVIDDEDGKQLFLHVHHVRGGQVAEGDRVEFVAVPRARPDGRPGFMADDVVVL